MSQEHAQTERPSFLERHFYSAEEQSSSAKLGMWLFLGQELMFFGGLLIAYFAFRFLYPQAFVAVQEKLCIFAGTVQTIVLLTGSLSMVFALKAIQNDRKMTLRIFLFITLLLTLALLGMRYIQYSHMAQGGLFSKAFFTSSAMGIKGLPANAHIVYALFLILTGLHSLHLLVGLFLLVWLCNRARKGNFNIAYNTPVENVGLFWHMGTFVWIFLFPLIYLAR